MYATPTLISKDHWTVDNLPVYVYRVGCILYKSID